MTTLATGSYHNRRFEIRCPDDATKYARRGPVWSMFLYENEKCHTMVHDEHFVDLYQEATKFVSPTYNHSYSLYFSVGGSTCPDGSDVTPEMLKAAVLKRIEALDDSVPDWLDAVGDPTDSYKEQS